MSLHFKDRFMNCDGIKYNQVFPASSKRRDFFQSTQSRVRHFKGFLYSECRMQTVAIRMQTVSTKCRPQRNVQVVTKLNSEIEDSFFAPANESAITGALFFLVYQ